MNTIAYLLYGTPPEYQLELTYAVLSAKHFIDDRIGLLGLSERILECPT